MQKEKLPLINLTVDSETEKQSASIVLHFKTKTKPNWHQYESESKSPELLEVQFLADARNLYYIFHLKT